ncbi:competence protein ComK [Liberiplasma polymorphum]|uniref:competence protein ComK n=1 Tax=Liberiplasma polymorphum TaxID=3374570 RepID=UPI00377601D1
MHYVKKHVNGIEVVFPYRQVVLEKGLIQFINTLLIKELTTFDGRIEALKKQCSLKYNVPIYINHKLCLFSLTPLRDTDVICLNVHAIQAIIEQEINKTMIIFNSNETLILNYNYRLVKKRYDRTIQIIEKLSN